MVSGSLTGSTATGDQFLSDGAVSASGALYIGSYATKKWMANGDNQGSSPNNITLSAYANHGFTGASGNASGSITATSTTTTTISNTGSGTEFDVKNPYITVYMFRRIS